MRDFAKSQTGTTRAFDLRRWLYGQVWVTVFMNNRQFFAGRWGTPALTALILGFAVLQVRAEETFALLQIGAQTFQNVTVTTKAKTYIFLMHSTGMTTVKVADLPKDLRLKLGYAEQENTKTAKGKSGAWAKQTLAKLEVPEMTNVKAKLMKTWSQGNLPASIPMLDTRYLLVALGIILGLYFFSCYCGMLICRKAGLNPGFWIWVPVLQVFPMLAAAGMSAWWFLGLMVPGLNLVGGILWSFKIARVRRKSPLTAILLLLPVISFLAFVYLAFSDTAKGEDDDRRVEIMTLETA